MSITPETLFAGQKAFLNTFITAQQTALNSLEQLVELNFKAARSGMEQLANQSGELLNLKDPQQLASFAQGTAQANPEQLAAYSKHLYDIISTMQAELAHIAEAHAGQQQQLANQTFDIISKNAPAGSESALALLKNSLSNLGTAYDTATKAAKQAAAVAESNINVAMSGVTPKKSSGRKATK